MTSQGEKKVTLVECINIERRGNLPGRRYNVYVLGVTWSNGDRYPIYRKYSCFFDLEKSLKQRLGSNCSVPELPAMNVFEKALKIEKNHISDIARFCMDILALPDHVISGNTISGFFEVWNTDYPCEDINVLADEKKRKAEFKRKENKKKNDTKERLSSSSDVDETPAVPYRRPPAIPTEPLPGEELEEFIAVEDYEASEPTEVSLKKGATFVVIEQNADGWWFVMRNSDQRHGYAPGSFLELKSGNNVGNPNGNALSEESFRANDESVLPLNGQTNPMFVRALTNYNATSDDELSCQAGDELEVMSTPHHGWWQVRVNGRVGLIPAVHLDVDSTTAKSSKLLLRNNTLYPKRAPPRNKSVTELRRPDPTYSSIRFDNGPSPIRTASSDIKPNSDNPKSLPLDDDMSLTKVPPNRSRDTAPLNYAELVFDENKNSKIITPKESSPKEKQASDVIYTQIIPKSNRPGKGDRTTTANQKDESVTPVRNKAVKKPSRDAPVEPAARPSNRSPPPPPYENHKVSVLQKPTPEERRYVNIQLPDDDALAMFPASHFLRRSSIEPAAPPQVDAPKPSICKMNKLLDDSLISPMITRIQAVDCYTGPPISGMLMFNKGDVATVMSQDRNSRWWYVSLNGCEGYVPGDFWEVYRNSPNTSSPASVSPCARRRAPQPVPRSTSPPLTQTATDNQKLESNAWYHGKMSRPESETLLQPLSNGQYLIRESLNRVGDLTLSVKWEEKVRHFPIEAKEGGLFYIGKHDFKDLMGVVHHYSKHALFFDNSVAVKLKKPAPKI